MRQSYKTSLDSIYPCISYSGIKCWITLLPNELHFWYSLFFRNNIGNKYIYKLAFFNFFSFHASNKLLFNNYFQSQSTFFFSLTSNEQAKQIVKKRRENVLRRAATLCICFVCFIQCTTPNVLLSLRRHNEHYCNRNRSHNNLHI